MSVSTFVAKSSLGTPSSLATVSPMPIRSLVSLLLLPMMASGCASAPQMPSPQPTNGGSVEDRSKVSSPARLAAKLEASFAAWEAAGPTGDADHKARLEKLAVTLAAGAGSDDVLFVCTHNSRRSHIAQLVGLAAARRNGLDRFHTFSGGTEVTAFNPRAIAALTRVGFEASPMPGATNPHVRVGFGTAEVVESFSKRIADAPNPRSGFVVVMTCSQADAACPLVDGARARVAIPYEDPKVADGTPEETARYDERVEQIGRDLTWVFAEVAKRVAR